MSKIYKYNPRSQVFDIVYDTSLVVLKGAVDTTSDLPLSGNSQGDLYVVKNGVVDGDNKLYSWNKEGSSGILSDWDEVGSISSIDWSVITNKPSSSVANIDLAVIHKDVTTSNPHSVNKSDVGLSNVDNKSEATIITDVKADIDVASAISLKHTQGTDTGTNSSDFSINGSNAIKEGDSRLTDARTPVSHGVADNTKHSSSATSGQMLKADTNGLPVNATNTDIDVASAVTLKHTQNTDETAILNGKEANISAITKGQAVCYAGSSGTKIQFGLANCTNTSKDKIIGLAYTNIDKNANGAIVSDGLLVGIDTRATNLNVNPNAEVWLPGDLLWLSGTDGGLTNVRPISGRCIKVARTVKGNSATDELIILAFENPVWVTGASGEDVVLRVGDEAGVNKVSIRDYANNEVASVNSNGIIAGNNLSGTNTGDQESSDFTHNSLSGLNDGEYKHLGSLDYTELVSWLDDVTLGADGSITVPTTIPVYFRDANLYISSKDDGHLDIDGDVSVDINSPSLNTSAIIATGNTNISKADPEDRLTDTGNNEYSRIVKSDTTNSAIRYNRILKAPANVKCLQFGGIDETAYVNSNLGITDYPFTFECWFKSSDVGTSKLLFGLYDKDVTNIHYGVQTTVDNQFEIFARNTTWVSSITTGVYVDGNWHHVMAVFASSSDARLYVDGNATPAATLNSGVIVGAIDRFSIGAHGDSTPSAYMVGYLDEVIVYNADVSATLATRYNSGIGIPAEVGLANARAIYHLDDGTGSTAVDSTANAYHMTLSSMEEGDWVTGYVGSTGTMEEVQVWKSEDGIDYSEDGVITYGDYRGRTVLKGASLRMFIGSAEQVRLIDGTLYPITNNDIDLGTSVLQYKDIYIDGKAYIDGFAEDTLFDTTKKIQFRDTALYISSVDDGHLDLTADISVDINANTILSVGKYLCDADLDTTICLEETADVDEIVIKTANVEAMRIHDNGIVSTAKQSGCKYTRGIGQSISNAVATTIQFTTKVFDIQTEYDNSTDYDFTAKEDGIYLVIARITFDSAAWTAGQYIDFTVRKNGVLYGLLSAPRIDANITKFMGVEGMHIIQLSAGQYIDVQVYHNRGDVTNLEANANVNYLCVSKIA